MWPFTKKHTILNSGMLQGLTDWHSHILPGVDDGFQKMEDSIAILNRYEELGVKRVWLTPHIMEDYPNTTDNLRERFLELENAFNGKVELRLASENMLDPLFEERLEKRDFLPIGKDGSHLLVETSYFNPPYGMEDMIEGIISAGFTPLLAHPERYRYMEEKDYRHWRSRGVHFQMNYISLTGGYGETARRKAEWLLKNGMIDVCGSDVHRQGFFEQNVAEPIKKNTIDNLLLVGNAL